jgi:hypothetical protein
MVQQGHQPSAGIAAVEQQQIVRGKPVEMLDEALPFAAFAGRASVGTNPSCSALAINQSLSRGMAMSDSLARLRERLFGHLVNQLGLLAQMGEERVSSAWILMRTPVSMIETSVANGNFGSTENKSFGCALSLDLGGLAG